MTIEKEKAKITAYLRVSRPESGKYDEWLVKEMQNYSAAVGYVSFFIEARARMGDKDTEELFEEFKANVCMMMRGGFDILGTQ